MRIVPASLTIAFFLSLGVTARAEEVKPYPECTQASGDPVASGAKAAFQAGEASFNEADYPRAILYWEDAFRRECSATSMLLNLARAYELNNQKRQAVVALETYLQREPNSPERAQITRRIEALKKQLESEPAAQPTPAPTPAPTSTAPSAQPDSGRPPLAQKSATGTPVVPLVVIGVGGAMFIVGGLVFLGADAEVKKFERECTETPTTFKCPNGQEGAANAAVKRRNVSGAITVVSLPVIAGGIIWYIVAKPSKEQATKVTPTVGQNFLGLSVDGRF